MSPFKGTADRDKRHELGKIAAVLLIVACAVSFVMGKYLRSPPAEYVFP